MAASRLIPTALRAAPLASLGLLIAWTAVDILAIGGGRDSLALLEVLGVGVGLLLVAALLRRRWIRPIGLGAVVASYMIAHVFFLGVQVVPALVFVVVVICQVELQILAERFGGLYEAALASADRVRIRAALGRAVLRLMMAAALGVLVPMLAANLAVAGVVPVTSIPTAILLAAALVGVVLLIALLPTLRRRTT